MEKSDQTTNNLSRISWRNIGKLVVSSDIFPPKKAIMKAPLATRAVPIIDDKVNGSCSINELNIELKTNPRDCNGERAINGRLTICIVEPNIFAEMNRRKPMCHIDLL